MRGVRELLKSTLGTSVERSCLETRNSIFEKNCRYSSSERLPVGNVPKFSGDTVFPRYTQLPECMGARKKMVRLIRRRDGQVGAVGDHVYECV